MENKVVMENKTENKTVGNDKGKIGKMKNCARRREVLEEGIIKKVKRSMNKYVNGDVKERMDALIELSMNFGMSWDTISSLRERIRGVNKIEFTELEKKKIIKDFKIKMKDKMKDKEVIE